MRARPRLQGSRLVLSPVAYAVMVELLCAHGGAEGFRQAVLLVRAGHNAGVLRHYTSATAFDAAAGVGEAGAARRSGSGSGGGGGCEGDKDDEEEAHQNELGERLASTVAQAALGSLDDLVGAEAEAKAAAATGRKGGGADQGNGKGGRAGGRASAEGEGEGGGMPEAGSWVALSGASPAQAAVVLLAWIDSLVDAAARCGVDSQSASFAAALSTRLTRVATT